MKATLVVLAVFVAVAVASPAGKITTKYDNIDVDAILKNKRLFNAYIACVLDGIKCTPDGQVLRDSIPEALQNDCDGCSKKQKEVSERILPIISKEHPVEWQKLRTKYDPENKYADKYATLAKEKGVAI